MVCGVCSNRVCISQGGEGRVWSVVSVVTVVTMSLYLRVVRDACGLWCLW